MSGRGLGMRPGELDGQGWASFWNPRMAALPAHVAEALRVGPVAAPLLPDPAEVARALRCGEVAVEDALSLEDDGAAHLALHVDFPGAVASDVDWWFAWHGSDARRYKLWHPLAHVHAAWDEGPEPAGPGGYIGRTSFVDEYIASRLQHASIRFLPPAELGFAPEEGVVTVCARIGLVREPVDLGYLAHHVRPVPGGAVMHSRFWIGGRHAAVRGPASGLVSGLLRRLRRPGTDDARALLVHCASEMQHLAGFLPALRKHVTES